ncbi:Zinc finger protein 277 [Plakobranchus ocellatus]|uniref:Zinc finger protein 277 n=1 Tax=Plakobranchus ocellatus TaxID=259542 RepID=A0AAV4AH52_9GAST|nr:Zinc finger protein 277 [Plakobranchus ocellatus]
MPTIQMDYNGSSGFSVICEQVLAQQQREREETKFCRQCLFCKQTFCGNRAVLFDHLLRDHMFHMGQPDNLVFTDELFDLIQFKLDSQLCLFCEKSFKDKPSLREHMRKKQHRKINPKNKEYDRFYIINYMEMGKNWESLQQEDNRLVKINEGSDEEAEWADWNEECQHKVVCLFCDSASADQQDLQKHMKEYHSFDLQGVNQKLQLNFYQKVKLINYIRRQVYHKTCYGCQETFSEKSQLTEHMTKDTDHINRLPEANIWDQAQYFFPTYEDDNLLCHLDDDDEGAAGDALGVTVYAEDIPVSDSTILRDQKLHRELLRA